MMKTEITELKVSGNTNPNKLGGAIVKYLDEEGRITLSAVGSRAVNQAVKGIIVAQSYLASGAEALDVKFGFKNKDDQSLEKEITLIVFHLAKK